jgi:alpha-glucosidase
LQKNSFMRFSRPPLCIAVLLTSCSCFAQPTTLRSPNGNIRWVFEQTDRLPAYSVWYGGKLVISASPLDLLFLENGDTRPSSPFGNGPGAPAGDTLKSRMGAGFVAGAGAPGPARGWRTGVAVYREGKDDYTLPVGRNSVVHDRYNEYTIPLEETTGRHRRLSLVVRLYDDGLAFRWIFPALPNRNSFRLVAENTGFRLEGDPIVLASFLPGFTTSHENRYTRQPFSAVKPDTLMDMPVFLQWPGGDGNPTGNGYAGQPGSLYMVITEAQLTDYAGMYLVKHDGMLKSELSPLPGGPAIVETSPVAATAHNAVRVKAGLPHRSPWRVVFIGERPGAFLESNLLTDLNEPCAIKDLSWLHPGKTDFHWWNGDILPDTTISPGINFETNQYYIDFCARNGIDYHTVIGFGGTAWYVNDGVSYDAGPHSDPSRPIPGLDMKQICDYAASKGVGIRVWVHWKALWPHIDTAFARLERWGIRGMMVDFMNRDDQEMVNVQTTILRKAAQHHLHIQFHGAYKPTGLIRTWPNELTREGTLNYENDKWNDPITPDDDLNVVFTRLMAGATDYHLGGFRAATPGGYRPQFTRPLVLGTRCHMLAMYVVLESYLPMVCDYPAAYEGQAGFDFLKSVPSTWDETRVPVAIPREWVAIARRKGNDWYVGAINNHAAREADIPLSFLPAGNYEATIYADAPDADKDPNHLVVVTRTVGPADSVRLSMAGGGGQAIRIRRVPY